MQRRATWSWATPFVDRRFWSLSGAIFRLVPAFTGLSLALSGFVSQAIHSTNKKKGEPEDSPDNSDFPNQDARAGSIATPPHTLPHAFSVRHEADNADPRELRSDSLRSIERRIFCKRKSSGETGVRDRHSLVLCRISLTFRQKKTKKGGARRLPL
jgi:hypothetical protein